MHSRLLEKGIVGGRKVLRASQNTEVPTPPDVPEAFAVHDEASANWVIRKIIEARHYLARVKSWAEAETSRVEHEEDFFMRRFGPELETWTRSQLKGKRKCVSLPAGRVGFRTAGAKLVVDDQASVLNWARKNCPDAVVVIERLRKTELNRLFKEEGEIPETGAHVEPEREAFYVR